MNDLYLILTPVLMLGVLALARFVACDVVWGFDRPPDQTEFVVSIVPGSVRNNFTGWVGMAIEVGPSPIVVRELGRAMLLASAQPHIVKIVRALADGTGENLGSVSIPPSPAKDFAYETLASPVHLTPMTRYYVVSHEELGGDSWYHSDTTIATTNVALVPSAVFNEGDNLPYFPEATLTHTYGPVDFKYSREQ